MSDAARQNNSGYHASREHQERDQQEKRSGAGNQATSLLSFVGQLGLLPA